MGVWEDIRTHPQSFIMTLTLITSSIGFGLVVAIPGPCLLDLKQQLHTNLRTVSLILTARGSGGLVGSFLCGLIYSKLNPELALGFCNLWAAAFTILVPFVTETWMLVVVFLLSNLGVGAIEALCNAFMLHLWGKSVAPFMQTFHAVMGVGLLLAPSIALPFVVSDPNEGRDHNPIDEDLEEEVDLFWPFAIVSMIIFLNSIFCFCVWFIFPKSEAHESRSAANNDAVQESGQFKRWKKTVIFLSFIFMHIFFGLLIGFGDFLPTYAVESTKQGNPLKLTKPEGIKLTIMFRTLSSFFRLIFVFQSFKISNSAIIFISLLLIFTGSVIMYFSYISLSLFITGVALFGCGMSSVWASLFGFLESYFPVSPLVSSLITTCAVAGELVFPFIFSNVITTHADILIWTTGSCAAVTCVLFAFMFFICETKLRHKITSDES